MLIAGIDGAKKGTWLSVTQDTESGEIQAQTVYELDTYLTANQSLKIVAIDIPIGLTDSGPRECDLIARKLLSPRGSCVFPAPIRAVLKVPTYQAANALSRELQAKGISKQAYEIFNRIAEVDDLLAANPHLQGKVFEIHPELCFAAWLGSPESPTPLPSKRTAEGLEIRRQLIASHFGPTAVDTVRPTLRRGTFAEDDLLDAFAALWTAKRLMQASATRCPQPRPCNAPAIWY